MRLIYTCDEQEKGGPSMVKELIINGERCANLPGSNYWVTRDGTLFKMYAVGLHPNRPGYYVSRKLTKRYYSKGQLARLYRKFIN